MTDDESTRALTRLWGQSTLRVFISHTHHIKDDAGAIQRRLSRYGVAAFVAHESITPTLQWQREVVYALSTMNILIALLTIEFKVSDWADQEVGAAAVRDVPIVPVNLGQEPYGFLAQYQAITPSVPDPKSIADTAFSSLMQNPLIRDKQHSAMITALKSSPSFAISDQILHLMSQLERFSEDEEVEFLSAYNENEQVHKSVAYSHFPVSEQLLRLTGKRYELSEDGKIEVGPEQLSNSQMLEYVFGSI